MNAKQVSSASACGQGETNAPLLEGPLGFGRQSNVFTGAQQRNDRRNKFENLLKSSCNFSLGCVDELGASLHQQAHAAAAGKVAPKRINQQHENPDDGPHHLVKRSRMMLEMQREMISPNSTARLFGAQRSLVFETTGTKNLLRFSQADAAGAMVGFVRVILVILICVLMVKLHAIPGVANSSNRGQQHNRGSNKIASADQISVHRRRRRRNSSKRNGAEVMMHDEEDTNNHEESHRVIKKISPIEQHITIKQNETNFQKIFNKLSLITSISYIRNGIPDQQHNQQRRLSQPVFLPSATMISTANWQQKAANAHERRRRFSDTTAIISSLQLPPGPIGLPFLGYLPFLGTEIHLTLTQLGQRFGPIYQIFLGGIRVVVLNDASLVRQAFKQTVFSGRPDTQLTRILQGYGIVNSDGALWKEQRAFLHSALRKLGAKSLMSGTSGLEAKIQNQVREFVKDLSQHADEGKPCQVRPIVARAVSSVVGSVVMNLTYRKYEQKFDRLIELMQEGFRLVSIAMPLVFIPLFRFLPGVSYAFQKMKRNRAETSAFFQTVADEHRRYLRENFNLDITDTTSSLHPKVSQMEASSSGLQQANIPKTILTSDTITRTIVKQSLLGTITKDSNDQVVGEVDSKSKQPADLDNIVARDLVDAYIVQQKKHENDGKENYFSDQQLVQIMSDIFSAGLETVTSTIEWSILFLILNPECQEKIQEEIDKIVGRSRMPQLDDLAQMPYTEATIYEVLRRSNVIALGNAHATLADATIGGYRIPKGTQVLPNLYGIHMNPKLWAEPERFDPSRFIVNERAQKPDYFIPFSVGRRMCLGDVLAKMEVFLFLVGLLQKYDLSVHEDDRACPPEVKGTIGVSNAPVPFRVALRARGDSVRLHNYN